MTKDAKRYFAQVLRQTDRAVRQMLKAWVTDLQKEGTEVVEAALHEGIPKATIGLLMGAAYQVDPELYWSFVRGNIDNLVWQEQERLAKAAVAPKAAPKKGHGSHFNPFPA